MILVFQFPDKHDVVVVFVQRIVKFFQDFLVGIGAVAFFQSFFDLLHQLQRFVHHKNVTIGEVGIYLQSAYKVVSQLDEMRLLGLKVSKDMAFASYVCDVLAGQWEVDAIDVVSLTVVLHHKVGFQAIGFMVVGIKRIRYSIGELQVVCTTIVPYLVTETRE
jgi:hypothetical protein